MVSRLRSRLPSPTMVVACLALAVALGGTAFAASKLGSGAIKNNSLKSVDLKNNAGVKGADVVDGSLKGADVADGSLTGADVTDDSLTGADVNESTMAVSRVVAQVGGAVGQPIGASAANVPFPNAAYTQPADESDQYIPAGQLTFGATCIQPRSAIVYLLIDDPTIVAQNVVGLAQVQDTGTGAVTRRFNVSPFSGGGNSLTQFRPGVVVPHQFFLAAARSCSSGSGVTLDSLNIDVVGHR